MVRCRFEFLSVSESAAYVMPSGLCTRPALRTYAARAWTPPASDPGDSLRCFRRLCAVLAVSVVAGPALAQEESFNPGTVWNFSYIKVEPGQMNRYMDYLARWESARATSSLITCSR